MKNKNKSFRVFLFLFLISLLAGFFGFGKSGLAVSPVAINEIMYSPEGTDVKHEWLEIFNPSTESVDLSNWILFEANTNHRLALYQGSLTLDPGEYSIIADDAGTFKSDHSGYAGTIIDSVFSFSNSGESFSIKNGAGEIISEASYASDLGADGNGLSIERDELGYFRESYSPSGTPGEKNSEKPKPKVYSDKIIINELLPAPSFGKEEYIELYNPTEEAIDLAGWKLTDASKTGKYVFPSGNKIEPLDYLVVYKDRFKFALNNSGAESITFFDPNEKNVSSISYSGSKTDVSYNFDGTDWRWSKFLTPGRENLFNNLPEVSKKKDNKIYAKAYADFSAKGYDKDKDKLKFTWDFGDGHKSYQKETRHKFKKAGKYKITLKISDGTEDKIETFDIEVEKFPKRSVRIISISPNPLKKDSENEFIVVKNDSTKKVNLKGWGVATGSKKLLNHPILDDLVVQPGKTAIITHNYSKFSLNNKKSKVELRYPDGKVASKMAYDKKQESVKEDEIYTKESGQWAWIAPKTEIKLAVVENPDPVEASPQIALGSEASKLNDIEILMADGKNFSEDENLLKNAMETFARPQGVVLGAAIFSPTFSGIYLVQNKPSFFEIIFLRLNSAINYFLNKLS